MQLEAIFKKADTNQDGKVSADELAALLATSEERCFLVHFRGYPRHLWTLVFGRVSIHYSMIYYCCYMRPKLFWTRNYFANWSFNNSHSKIFLVTLWLDFWIVSPVIKSAPQVHMGWVQLLKPNNLCVIVLLIMVQDIPCENLSCLWWKAGQQWLAEWHDPYEPLFWWGHWQSNNDWWLPDWKASC